MSEIKDNYKLVTKVDDFQRLENEGRVRVVLDGTLSYPHIVTPQQDRDDPSKPPRYNMVLLGEWESEAKEELKKTLADVGKDFFPALKKVPNSLKDGGEKPDEKGYEGKYTISASNGDQPKLYILRTRVTEDPEGKFYAGAKVRMVASLWKQNNKFGKRVNLSLELVQWLGDGERLGGRLPVCADDYLSDIGLDGEGHDPLA